MILLKDILLESEASEKAKQLGLKSIGFGRYVKPGNPKKVAAKTINGKLQMVKGKDEPINDPLHPDQLSLIDLDEKTIQIGQTKIDDFNKSNDENKIVRSNFVKGEQTIIYPCDVGQPDSSYNTDKNWEQGHLEYYTLTGKTVVSYDFKDPKNKEKVETFNDNEHKVMIESMNDAVKQHNEWRMELSDSDQQSLLETQNEWQESEHWNSYNKEYINREINKLCEDVPQVTVSSSTGYIERGMSIPNNNIKEFLFNFQIGKNIILPPSGFSSSTKVARGFVKMGIIDRPSNHVGVLLKLKPRKNNNTVTGVHLSFLGDSKLVQNIPSEDEMFSNEPIEPDEYQLRDDYADEHDMPIEPDKDDHDTDEKYEEVYAQYEEDLQEYEEDLQSQLDDIYSEYEDEKDEWQQEYDEWKIQYGPLLENEYDYEREIIHPGNVQQKVVNVKKHVFPITPKGRPQDLNKPAAAHVLYEIEMEEAGEVDRELWAEVKYLRELELMMEKESLMTKAKLILKRYVNNRVVREPRPSSKEKTFRKYTNTNVKGK